MATPATTRMLIRAQAKGGKFLADDIGGAEVTVRDARTGQWLGGGRIQGTDSGTLQTTYAATASLSTVVTPGNPPLVQWLVAGPTTSGLTVDLPLTHPTLLEVEVYGPLGGLQSAQRVVTRTWALPGQPITQGPGFVVELPGLVVQVQQPPTHQEFSSVPASTQFLANVAMMCGCPIGTGLAWIPSDFTVTATVERLGSKAKPVIVPLQPLGAPSIFSAPFAIETTGFYQAVISAVQKSTGNTGAGMVTFFTKP